MTDETTRIASELNELARKVLALDAALDGLEQVAQRIGTPSPRHADWYTLLKQKILPQITERSLIVVAVTGGTNTGKSLLFNVLAGENASSVDARAAGTKHPVCLVPETPPGGLEPQQLLRRYFEDFTTVEWSNPQQPLQASDDHRLYWRTGRNVPAKLMVLDTPDIDSDVAVNWDRAAIIRQAADILLAVLTPQKYNDAAVRRFFREAAASGKQVILIWNMVDLDAEADPETAMLPRWTGQFCEETGVEPLAVYVVPHDREAAANRSLPIHPYLPEEKRVDLFEKADLADMLSGRHFETIKVRALLGALRRVLSPETGIPAYLDTLRRAAGRFREARQALLSIDALQIDWPDLPTGILVEEIRNWWHEGRPGWSRNVHGAYRKIGNGILWPVRKTIGFFSKEPPVDPLERFKADEYNTVILVVEKTVEQLERLAETDNPVLRSELHALLGGDNRQKLFDQAKRAHLALDPMSEDFRNYLYTELDRWSGEHPTTLTVTRSLDHVAAIARPAVTVTLLAGGFFGASQIINQAGVQVAEVAITGGITAGGEAAVHKTGEGITQGAAKFFQKVRVEFARQRARHFFDWFQRELWSDTTARLDDGARIVETPPFQAVEETLEQLLSASYA